MQGQLTRVRARQLTVRAQAQTGPSPKRVLVTGGNTGIGFESAKELAAKGYEIVLACRDNIKADAAVKRIQQAVPGASVSTVACDLANQASIRDCAARLLDEGRPFDVLLNNAGVMAPPKMQTADGYELQLGVNHLGHWTLTSLLLPGMIEANKPARIVNVSSMAHQMGSINFNDLMRDKPGAYNAWEAYGQSKLANIHFTYELAKRLRAYPDITVNCLHPGVVRTELGRYMVNDSNRWLMAPLVAIAMLVFLTPEEGAKTSIYLASSPEVEGITSKFFDKCRPVSSSSASYNTDVAAKLWDISAELTGVEASIPARKSLVNVYA